MEYRLVPVIDRSLCSHITRQGSCLCTSQPSARRAVRLLSPKSLSFTSQPLRTAATMFFFFHCCLSELLLFIVAVSEIDLLRFHPQVTRA